ncbi:stealth conserved region 3 domain-containing protein [Streptomyces violens]|uniref:stealth conserved region 3 domain-containing protein n=1 Tax=Streptomyces violens TaxID=66377 RepID=UPI0004BE8CC8|nr:stealth conserved region 3 domain-containing protein [Streptomyces violens]
MRITFLLTLGDEMGGTEMAAYTQAAHLAARHDVEVLSVFRTHAEPFFPAARDVRRRYLVDRTGPYERPVRASALDEAACRTLAALPSELIKPAWEHTFNRLSDIELGAAIAGLDTDVLVTTTPALMAAAAELVQGRVITVHQEHRASQLRGVSGEPLLMYAPRIDALVSLTERTEEWFRESLGPAAPELATIPNALPDGYRPRSDLTGRLVVAAARLTPEKQLDHAVRAFAQAAEDHPDWRLRIFGDGPQAVRLRQLIDGLALHDRVELLGRTPDMAAEWAKASLCLLPSRNEAFGLVLVEAFAAGVPAIAYDIVTGPAEIIRHGVDGLLVPPADVDALAAALGELMGDQERLRAYGNAARAGVYERFSGERVTAEWERLFEKLVARRDGPDRLAARADRTALRIAAGGGRAFSVAAPHGGPLAASADTQKAREVLLKAQDRTGRLVRSAGRLAELRDDLTAPQAADRNLELATDALTAHGIGYVLLRDDALAHRVAVAVEDRERALAALAEELAGEPVYGELVSPRGHAPGALLAERLREAGEVAGVRVFKPVTSESRTLRYGPGFGCTVEFWAEDEDGWREAPRGTTLLGPRLPSLEPTAKWRVADRDHPTLAAFTDTLMWDIDFPVDVVYTWVDDSDPDWRERRDAALRAAGFATDGVDSSDARFRSRDELRHSLRSLAMYAPWVRTVHLVTDDQVPDWLDIAHPGLKVIDHRELFADPSLLPTFNSHAIESQLHRIEGLSEQFLYINDDVFFGRPVPPSAFFHSNGTAHFFRSPTAVPPGEVTEDDEGYFAAAKNNRALLKREFGRVATHGFLHAPHPLRRSVLAELADRFPEEVAATAGSRFRARTDLSIASSLHHYYGYLTGKSTPATISCSFANAGRYDHHTVLSRLLATRSHSVFCIGDSADAEVPAAEQDRVVRAFLGAYFPVPSPYERG